MHIRDWPEAERPREKLLARGPGSLSDAELLALFLGSGRAGQDAVSCARTLLSNYDGLRKLLDRDANALTQLRGIGPARACLLAAALELGQRHLAAQLQRGEALARPDAAGRYFCQRLRGLRHEVFAVLYLDTQHRALGFEELFRGSIDGAEVHPRIVVQRALAHGAAAAILGHNHPSGNPQPSAADRAVTTRIKQALALVDIRLLDHFVIGDGAPTSMAELGMV
ncbi:MAG: DNA repair protein RadC [Thermomonas sp.]|uniref:RadC family protein n=1 Tax=Thermomonas sp. TaxID=1971895 RepID=UPI001ED54869|nr:DNA repair protein RadC [Thermomonas sp.]MBV2209650.1 DNA repair protein RadC [Thermomonas sp.]